MDRMDDGYTFSMGNDETKVKIVALGIGGMGNNAMENLAVSDLKGLELYSVNTDYQALQRCVGSRPIQIGAKRTNGKGSGGNHEVGRLSAEDDLDVLAGLITGAEVVFIAAGMGGGTGTGAAPVVARLCRDMGILSVGVVTTPIHCEGRKRTDKAVKGLDEMRRHVDSLVVIENERLSLLMDQEDVSIVEVLRRADQVLLSGVKGILGTINSHGYINLDLADLKNVLQRRAEGRCNDAMIGIGEAHGNDRAVRAATEALKNQIMTRASIQGAHSLLVNVAGDENMGHREALLAVETIARQFGNQDRELFMGVVTDAKMGNKISVTVIATGIGMRSNDQGICGVAQMSRDQLISKAGLGTDAYHPDRRMTNGVNDVVLSEIPRKEIEDGFGISPLVAVKEWCIPAFQRKKSKYRNVEVSVLPLKSTTKSFPRGRQRDSRKTLGFAGFFFPVASSTM
ncbi:MAG: cell division FtsZ family protein [Proteobacteria bacterium]|nr:cell division FtsZ family protein [Pseudomonadota bacterium]MBU1688639.1 cell division FtsZ family protein [Pseudomonadota bacterium]